MRRPRAPPTCPVMGSLPLAAEVKGDRVELRAPRAKRTAVALPTKGAKVFAACAAIARAAEEVEVNGERVALTLPWINCTS